MTFTDPIIGGESKLIRSAIQSPDYVPGVSGWTINRDGSAEFNDVIYRGEFRVTGLDGSYIAGFASNGIPIIAFNPRDFDPSNPIGNPPLNPGAVYGANINDDGSSRGYLEIISPEFSQPGYNFARIQVLGESYDHLTGTQVILGATNTLISGSETVNGSASIGGDLTVSGEVNFGSAVPKTADGATTAGTSTSTSFTNTLTTTGVHGTTFVAPPSGAVYIIGRANSSNSIAGAFSLMDFEVRTGSTIGSGTVVRAGNDGNCSVIESGAALDESMHCTSAMVTGLTPGDTYNAALLYKSGGTGTVRFTRRHIAVLPQANI